jgi:peptidoglycan/LPS O-acetylase OafA/YrhL|tara:strand:+ start:3574 stop:5409 length:1836 start_codon:yes stop_codon:yes gene_type:complete
VISGYLITSILVNDIRSETFSIIKFYDRRIRRIFPALFLVVGLSFVTAWFILLPSYFEDFSETVFAAAIFLSNVQFWREAGYFGADAELAPLLHTWSLAVEEQFYVFFPLLLAFFHRRSVSKLKFVLLVILTLSFVLSVYFVERAPDAAFYLTPMRAWELMVGCLLAVGFVPALRGRKMAEAVSALGLILIGVAIFGFDSSTPFPGFAALLPVLGTAALIHVGEGNDTFVRRVLSARFLVFVGLLSYSFYLFHWPIFVFYKHMTGSDGALSVRLLLVILSFVCAWLSWRFVERPFRAHGESGSAWRVLLAGGAVSTVFLGVGLAGNLTHGWPARFDLRFDPRPLMTNEENEIRMVMEGVTCRVVEGGRIVLTGASCDLRQNERSVLLLGDSHAAHLYPGLSDAMPWTDFHLYSAGGCRSIQGLNTRTDKESCGILVPFIFNELLPKGKFSAVILSGRWEMSEIQHLQETVTYIRRYASEVVVIGPVPRYKTDLPEALALWQGEYSRRFFDLNGEAEVAEIDRRMSAALASTDAVYISLFAELCSDGFCRTFADNNMVPLQWDDAHLTLLGSEYIADKILAPKLSELDAFKEAGIAKYLDVVGSGEAQREMK